MKTHTVQIELPLSVYTELQQMANACGWKFEDVVLQTVKMGMPPTLGKVPNAFHSELIALNKLDDKALMKVAAGEGEIAPTDDLHRKADFVALRRTYAMSLLRWRGHPLMGLEMM